MNILESTFSQLL